MVLLRGLDIGL